jgi:hypothetical protein
VPNFVDRGVSLGQRGAFPAGVYLSFLDQYLFIYWTGVERSPLTLRPFIGLLYQPCMIDGDDYVTIIGMDD